MPRGMIAARWDDRMGVTIEAAHPTEIENALEHDDLLTVFSTHAISEKSGVLAMRIKRLNIVSYYSGLPEGEQTEQYFVVVILEQDEDPNSYEERLTEVSKLIISAIDKPGFADLMSQFYDQLVKMEKITEEQRYAFIFRDRIRRLLLRKLAGGPMTKEGLAKWISKEIDKEITDIDGLLAPLAKTDLITEVNISKGKKVSLEYVFLMRDVAVIRVPNVDIFMAARAGQMAEDIREKYIEEVEKFFKEYRISSDDAGVLGEIASNPDTYDIVNALRSEYVTRAELPMKLPRDIPNLEKVLKEMAEQNIITAIKDKKGRIWVFLLSDIKFPTFFPEYMIDVIRRRWKEGTIAKEIALKHLELLRAEYIATEAPKYRKKMLKTILEYFENAEEFIAGRQYDQAATVVDTMAGLARDMGERSFGELLTNVGKLIREDKERYIEEEFEDDRVKIIEFIEAIQAADEAKSEPRKTKEVRMKGEKKQFSGASQIGKMDGQKAEQKMAKKKKDKAAESYQEPEEAFVEEEEEEPQSLPSDPDERRKALKKLIKQAKKAKDYAEQANLFGEMAELEKQEGNDKKATQFIDLQNKVAIKALIDMRDDLADQAKDAYKGKEYERAADLYAECATISNRLFKTGQSKEAKSAEKFQQLEAKAREKI